MTQLSIVLPFYKRVTEFQSALENNRKHLSKDMEVVLVLDEPESEKLLLELMQSEKGVRWKAVINRLDHPWRNPAKAINVGIRNASSDTVFVASPETRWLNQVPQILWQGVQKEPEMFHCGRIAFADPAAIKTPADFEEHSKGYTYGSICVKKAHLEAVRGYDESLVGWGADDDNLRARLRLLGCHDRTHHKAYSIHPPMVGSHRKYSESTAARIQEIIRPTKAEANEGFEWGTDFSEIFYEA